MMVDRDGEMTLRYVGGGVNWEMEGEQGEKGGRHQDHKRGK